MFLTTSPSWSIQLTFVQTGERLPIFHEDFNLLYYCTLWRLCWRAPSWVKTSPAHTEAHTLHNSPHARRVYSPGTKPSWWSVCQVPKLGESRRWAKEVTLGDMQKVDKVVLQTHVCVPQSVHVYRGKWRGFCRRVLSSTAPELRWEAWNLHLSPSPWQLMSRVWMALPSTWDPLKDTI